MFGLSLQSTVLVLTSILRPEFWYWSSSFQGFGLRLGVDNLVSILDVRSCLMSLVNCLLQVSSDGAIMTLLLSTRDTYVAVINLWTNRMMHELAVSGCTATLLSPNADLICTASIQNDVPQVLMLRFGASKVARVWK